MRCMLEHDDGYEIEITIKKIQIPAKGEDGPYYTGVEVKAVQCFDARLVTVLDGALAGMGRQMAPVLERAERAAMGDINENIGRIIHNQSAWERSQKG